MVKDIPKCLVLLSRSPKIKKCYPKVVLFFPSENFCVIRCSFLLAFFLFEHFLFFFHSKKEQRKKHHLSNLNK